MFQPEPYGVRPTARVSQTVSKPYLETLIFRKRRLDIINDISPLPRHKLHLYVYTSMFLSYVSDLR